jgi:calcineurin-like phosphoesterase family protein
LENVWFTSDPHFGHANIIKYCERPFSDIQEMNETLVRNWNAMVRPNDRVYLLGDVCFLRPDDAKRLLSRLMGRIYLVKGNHDKEQFLSECSGRFEWVKDYFELTHEKQKIIMSHFPFLTWNKSHHGSWSLHGHCHGNLPDDPHALRIDVGVDCHDFRPISFNEIKKIMAKKTFKPVDHHGAD